MGFNTTKLLEVPDELCSLTSSTDQMRTQVVDSSDDQKALENIVLMSKHSAGHLYTAIGPRSLSASVGMRGFFIRLVRKAEQKARVAGNKGAEKSKDKAAFDAVVAAKPLLPLEEIMLPREKPYYTVRHAQTIK